MKKIHFWKEYPNILFWDCLQSGKQQRQLHLNQHRESLNVHIIHSVNNLTKIKLMTALLHKMEQTFRLIRISSKNLHQQHHHHYHHNKRRLNRSLTIYIFPIERR